MASAHLLSKLKKLHSMYHGPHIFHGYDHRPFNTQLHAQINIGKGVDHYSASGHNNKHQNIENVEHNTFQGSHIKNEENLHVNSATGPIIFVDNDNKQQNNGYSSFQGSHVRHEDSFHYSNSNYPTNYATNTKYDSLNLNQHRPTREEHHKKNFALDIKVGK